MESKHAGVRPGEIFHEGLDDDWWASVLADENAYVASRIETPGRQNNVLEVVDWDLAQSLFERDEIVVLEVFGFNRGGILVQGDGLQGFVPVSHLVGLGGSLSEDQREKKLAGYVGKSLHLKVIECEPSLERVVLSERAAQAGEGRRKIIFSTLKIGDVVYGTVTNVTDFGVFVDLGGVEGLIHVSELSWGRVQHPTEICKLGQQVRTLVLQVCEETARVALSVKQLEPNPWDKLIEKHCPGDVVMAKITSIMRYGAFARLNEGVEGLIHVSSVTLPPNYKSLESYLSIGQPVQVRILHIDCPRRRLGLGLVSVTINE
jgi:small subunit ribosomal protein S1